MIILASGKDLLKSTLTYMREQLQYGYIMYIHNILTQNYLVLKTLLYALIELKVIYQKKVVVVVLLFYVHGKHLRSCRDGQLT